MLQWTNLNSHTPKLSLLNRTNLTKRNMAMAVLFSQGAAVFDSFSTFGNIASECGSYKVKPKISSKNLLTSRQVNEECKNANFFFWVLGLIPGALCSGWWQWLKASADNRDDFLPKSANKGPHLSPSSGLITESKWPRRLWIQAICRLRKVCTHSYKIY